MQVCTVLQTTTTPAPHHSVFTGRMPFLPPKVDLYNGCKMVVAVLLYVQGFTLKFVFEPNEYFTNEILTKEYLMKFGIDNEAPLEYDGPEIVKCKGSVLHYANVEF